MGREPKALYLGDTSYDTAASYLSLVLHHVGIPHDYVPSSTPLAESGFEGAYSLYIFSDYPSARVSAEAGARVLDDVRTGSGLLMIGGWESYQGDGGGYYDTPLAKALPVRISPTDDRVNSADPCCIVRSTEHPVVDGIDFSRPPTIAGYNAVTANDEAEVVLEVIRFATLAVRDVFSPITFDVKSRDPYLVVGSFGSGKTAALSSDLAPHWVGGFVDWGDERVRISHNGREVEVGDRYIQFISSLIGWLLLP